MQKVIFCDQYSSLGGGQLVLIDVLKALDSQFFLREILAPGGGLFEEMAKDKGILFKSIPELKLTQGKKRPIDFVKLIFYSFRLFFKFRSEFKKSSLIYINGMRFLPLALFLMCFYKTNFIFHIHIEHSRFEKYLLKLALKFKNTKYLICPSKYIYNELQDFSSDFESNKLILINNCLSEKYTDLPYLDRFSNTKVKNIAIVGRLSPEKGQDILSKIAPEFPEIKFHIIGDQSFSEEDYAEALFKNLPENVFFHGWCSEVPSLVNKLEIQIYLIPSRCDEAFGLTAVEACALSCIPIVRDRGNLSCLAESLSLPVFSQDDELVDLMHSVINRVSCSWASVTKKNYSQVRNHYSSEIFKNEIVNLINRSLRV